MQEHPIDSFHQNAHIPFRSRDVLNFRILSKGVITKYQPVLHSKKHKVRDSSIATKVVT